MSRAITISASNVENHKRKRTSDECEFEMLERNMTGAPFVRKSIEVCERGFPYCELFSITRRCIYTDFLCDLSIRVRIFLVGKMKKFMTLSPRCLHVFVPITYSSDLSSHGWSILRRFVNISHNVVVRYGEIKQVELNF